MLVLTLFLSLILHLYNASTSSCVSMCARMCMCIQVDCQLLEGRDSVSSTQIASSVSWRNTCCLLLLLQSEDWSRNKQFFELVRVTSLKQNQHHSSSFQANSHYTETSRRPAPRKNWSSQTSELWCDRKEQLSGFWKRKGFQRRIKAKVPFSEALRTRLQAYEGQLNGCSSTLKAFAVRLFSLWIGCQKISWAELPKSETSAVPCTV